MEWSALVVAIAAGRRRDEIFFDSHDQFELLAGDGETLPGHGGVGRIELPPE
jgi:hypothetical protein